VNASPLRVGVVGAGDVNRLYLPGLVGHPEVEVVVVGDRHPERSAAVAERFGVPAHGSVADVLAADVDAVLNLTGPASHLEITRAALERGRHVFSEKPFGTDLAEARSVLALAEAAHLVVACAPDTHLSPGFQDALRLLADGEIGDVVLARCEAVLAGPESWHPRPQFLYARGGGPLFDIGPYYVTALVAAVGSITRVRAVGTRRSDTRVIGSGPDAGLEFAVEVPTLVNAVLEFESGASGTLLLTFDSASHRGGAMELLGTRGTLRTPDPNAHDGVSSLLPAGSQDWVDVPLGDAGGGRPVGVLNFVRAVRGTEELRVPATLGVHVLEVMAAVDSACATGESVAVDSRVTRPAPLPAGWTAGRTAETLTLGS
jgi:predicted dehydrogenase